MAWATSSLIMVPSALLAIFAAIPPLIVHVRAKNFAASLLIIGLTILNFQNFINAIIWHSNDADTWWDGQILCDIEVKLYVGIFQAIDGANACIFRQIALILHPDHVAIAPSPRQHRLTWTLELILCLGLPIYVMVGHYLTQRSRYWIRTSAGCIQTTDQNYAAPFLTYGWLLVVTIIASIYSIICVARLYKHRKQMSSVLSHTPKVTTSRFYRLSILSFAMWVIYGPLSISVFVQSVNSPMQMFSWSHIHSPGWSERIFLNPNGRLGGPNIPFDRWAQVITAYLTFLFFGLGPEANEMYKSANRQIGTLLRACSIPKIRSHGKLNSDGPIYEMQPELDLMRHRALFDCDQVAQPHDSQISELSV